MNKKSSDIFQNSLAYQQSQTEERPFKCSMCAWSFAKSTYLKAHQLSVHSSKRPHECQVCHKRFSQQCTLSNHFKRSHTNERPFQCEICEKAFPFKHNLERHLKQHTLERAFQCDYCPKKFVDASGRNAHMKIIHSSSTEKPFECSTCNKRFKRKVELQRHVVIHTGEKRFICDICNRKFARWSGLSNHKVVHSSERKFKCNLCPKAFKIKQNLNIHMRIHTGEQNYHYCPVCKNRFKQKITYLCHLASHSKHEMDIAEVSEDEHKKAVGWRAKLRGNYKSPVSATKTHVCEICGEKYASKHNLENHIKIHTNERPFKCNYCAKTFREKSNLKLHQNTHIGLKPYDCKTCKRSFSQRGSLKNHIVRIHANPPRVKHFQCLFCDLDFYGRKQPYVHLRRHIEEKPYFCGTCGMEFFRSQECISHQKRQKHLRTT